MLKDDLNWEGWWIQWLMGDEYDLTIVNMGVLTIEEGEEKKK